MWLDMLSVASTLAMALYVQVIPRFRSRGITTNISIEILNATLPITTSTFTFEMLSLICAKSQMGTAVRMFSTMGSGLPASAPTTGV